VYSPQEPARPAQRRKVRIVKHRTISRAGIISLTVTGGVAILIIFTRQMVRTEEPIRPLERTLTDYELEWKCEQGHTFRAAGQVDPKVCWTCGQPSFPVAKFGCAAHGQYDVLVRFTVAEDGVPKPAEYRLWGTKEWTPAAEGVHCPRCRKPMDRVPAESLIPEKKREPRREERP
jgi:hypothetical protein